MALTKTEQVQRIEVVGEYKSVQVKLTTTVSEDGNIISESNSRYVIPAGHSYANEPQEVQDICGLVHTQEVITAYNEYINSLNS